MATTTVVARKTLRYVSASEARKPIAKSAAPIATSETAAMKRRRERHIATIVPPPARFANPRSFVRSRYYIVPGANNTPRKFPELFQNRAAHGLT